MVENNHNKNDPANKREQTFFVHQVQVAENDSPRKFLSKTVLYYVTDITSSFLTYNLYLQAVACCYEYAE